MIATKTEAKGIIVPPPTVRRRVPLLLSSTMIASAGAVAVAAVLIACTGMAGFTAEYIWRSVRILILTVAVLMATLILTGLVLALALVLALVLTPESTTGDTRNNRVKDVHSTHTAATTTATGFSTTANRCKNPGIQPKTFSSEMTMTPRETYLLNPYTDHDDSCFSDHGKVHGLAPSPDAVSLQRSHVVDSESSTGRVFLSSPRPFQPDTLMKNEASEKEEGTTLHVASSPSSSWHLSLTLPTPQSWAVTRSYYARMWERTRARIHQCYRYRSSPSSEEWTHPPQPYNYRYSRFCSKLPSTFTSFAFGTTSSVSNSGNNKPQSPPSAPHVELPYVGWTSASFQETPPPWSSILSAISCSRPPRRVVWGLALFFLITVATAETTSAPSPSEGTESMKAIPINPLKPISEQLTPPLAAGVPPPSHFEGILDEEAAYIQRLEKDRLERSGSFYFELTSEDLERAATQSAASGGQIRYSKEPLPWEALGLDENEDDQDNDENSLQKEEFLAHGWSSPWGGAFRYEALDDDDDDEEDYYGDEEQELFRSNQQKQRSRVVTPKDKADQRAFKAFRAADNDDGSGIVEAESSLVMSGEDIGPTRLELTTEDAPAEITRELKMEEADASGTNEATAGKDPNVSESFQELIVPQVWNAEGVSQKGFRGIQEYVERTSVVSPASLPSDAVASAGGTKDKEPESEASLVRPKMDQIDLLGHEAEIDWLNEQDRIQKAWKAKHHKHLRPLRKSKYEDDEDTPVAKSVEDMYNDHLWDLEHGGLHPLHYGPNKLQRRPNLARVEEQDIDVDGTLRPDPYSTEPYSRIVHPTSADDPDSPLGYIAYNHQGDRIMDFSMVGWNEGNTDLPKPSQIAVFEQLFPRADSDSDLDTGDDYDRIQSALDRVSQKTAALVKDETMIPTGALALARGVYRISKPLNIQQGGILFRGDPIGGTRIVCQWEPTGPRYAIEINGQEDEIDEDTRVPIVADYIPVGSYFLPLDPSFIPDAGLTVGDKVIVTRVGNERWIEDIGMDDFESDKEGVKPWKKMRSRMYRTIRAINPQTGIAQLDAPLPISIQRHYGGGWVTKYQDNKIRAIGVQFLDMVFPKNIGRTTEEMLDEKGRGSQDYRFSYEIFANYALRVDQAQHLYFSHITTAYFHNFISIGTDVHHVTMDSIVHSYPDDMLSGQSAFQLSGQFTLIRNTISQGSYHFYIDINQVMGPNVVHRAQATNVGKSYQPMPIDFAPGEIGPHMKFCTGMLFDQVVTDGTIQIVNRGDMGSGQGFAGANSVVWNSRAREGILTHRATGFQNFVIGSEDFEVKDRMPWSSHGWKEHLGSEVLPGSLYLRQLNDRLSRLAKGWLA